MIMKETYLETLKDAISNTTDSYFKNKNLLLTQYKSYVNIYIVN